MVRTSSIQKPAKIRSWRCTARSTSCNLYEYDMTEEDMQLLIEHYKRIRTNYSEPTKVYAPADDLRPL
jgi:hypothetical protein